MAEDLQATLRDVRDTLLSEPVSPRVETPADINLHYCHYVAEAVTDRLPDDHDVEILEDGGRGNMHTWLHLNGVHYDAECIEGVADYRDLPFFQRHPDAAVHVEPETADGAALRHRGKQPLYPEIFTADSRADTVNISRTTYWKYAVAGLVLGGALFAIGLSGEWAQHHQLIRESAGLHTIFVDLEILGELLVLVSPIIFFVLLPAHRADSF